MTNYLDSRTPEEREEDAKIESETKVAEVNQGNNMTKKILFFLPADNPWSRVIRRGVVIFVLTGLAGFINDILNAGAVSTSVWFVPILTALAAAIDKSLREFKAGK